ncbi:A disintegrin and metalloproteinase with thrombospondin motifs 12 [Apodemus speciosus]|uniref:A disintegrin and metalloproteinase with thrombospondin motifs 12 n=1 Tax=Apodemus speciosus TaxID=105296 RepID=A0ABQ0FJ36_APOSI
MKDHSPAYWIVGNWSKCSTTCGLGAYWRTVECSTGVNADCATTQRPDPAKKCHLRPCAGWRVGNWSKCSRNCSGGFKIREVQCMDSLDHHRSLRPFHCQFLAGVPPPLSMSCNPEPCEAWRVEPWSQQCSWYLQKPEESILDLESPVEAVFRRELCLAQEASVTGQKDLRPLCPATDTFAVTGPLGTGSCVPLPVVVALRRGSFVASPQKIVRLKIKTSASVTIKSDPQNSKSATSKPAGRVLRFNMHEGQTFNQLLPDTKIHEEVLCAVSASPVLPLMSSGTQHPHPEAKKTAVAPKPQHALGSERSRHHGPPQPETQELGPDSLLH